MLLPCQEQEPDTDGINPWMLLEDRRSSGPPSTNASNSIDKSHMLAKGSVRVRWTDRTYNGSVDDDSSNESTVA